MLTGISHLFIASSAVTVDSDINVFVHVILFTVYAVEVGVTFWLVVEVVSHVQLGFGQATMSPHCHQLAMSTIVVT